MQLAIAREMCELSQAPYLSPPEVPAVYTACDGLKGPTFPGLVVSNDEKVVVAFRGTQTSWASPEGFVSSVLQWLRNLNVQQDDWGGFRVHRGFLAEVNDVAPALRTMVLDHGAAKKSLYVTGHSAGGALATVAARRLLETGVGVDGVYVFGSPRVGDRGWARSFPVPLYRFEYMDDIVVHLPPPPSVISLLSTVFERFLAVLEDLLPYSLAWLTNIEYVHAGRLWFVDWDKDLYTVTSGLGEWGAAYGAVILELMKGHMPGIPVPRRITEFARTAAILERICSEHEQGDWGFIRHHDLRLTAKLIMDWISGSPYLSPGAS